VGSGVYEKIKEKRKIAVYKVRSSRQTIKNDVEYPKVTRKKMSLYIGILYKDRQTGINI